MQDWAGKQRWYGYTVALGIERLCSFSIDTPGEHLYRAFPAAWPHFFSSQGYYSFSVTWLPCRTYSVT